MLAFISTSLVCQQLACVVPYGEPVESYLLMGEHESPTLDSRLWDELDTQISTLIEAEHDRDRIERLELARNLLRESRMLPVGSQEEIIFYIESLLEIEQRDERHSIDDSSGHLGIDDSSGHLRVEEIR